MSHPDLIPLRSREDALSTLPLDIENMKRKYKQQGPDPKRFRTYENDDGDEYIVDKSLLPNDGYDMMSSESQDCVEEAAMGEKRMQTRRLAEQSARAFTAAEVVRAKERGKRRLSKAERQLRKTLSDKNYTNEDRAKALAQDEYNLVSLPAVSPAQAFINSILGPPPPITECFGCARGIGMARVAQRKISDLTQYIRDVISTQHVCIACIMVEEYFKTEIMIPSNSIVMKGEGQIPAWTARGVYEHLTRHVLEPSFVLYNCVLELRTHISVIMESGLYKYPREVVTVSDRTPGPADMIIDNTKHRQLMDSYKMLLQVMNQRPSDMLWSSTEFNTTSTSTLPISAKANAIEKVQMKSVFSQDNLAKKTTYKS